MGVLAFLSGNASPDAVRIGGNSGAVSPGSVFVGQLLAPAADNCTTPPYGFSGDTDTGLCSSVADTVNLRTGGTNRVTLSTSAETHTLPILWADGTAAVPSFGMASDQDGSGTGFFRSASNALGFSANGVATLILTSSNLTMNTGDAITLGQVSSNRQWMELYLSRGTMGSKTKILTETSATEFVRVAVPQTAAANYAGGKAIWTVYASDGTDSQSISGESKFTAVNKAGTETCAAIIDSQTLAAASAGTLTCTITCVTGLTDVVGLAANCTSSLTQTTLNILWRLDMTQVNTITPQ